MVIDAANQRPIPPLPNLTQAEHTKLPTIRSHAEYICTQTVWRRVALPGLYHGHQPIDKSCGGNACLMFHLPTAFLPAPRLQSRTKLGILSLPRSTAHLLITEYLPRHSSYTPIGPPHGLTRPSFRRRPWLSDKPAI
ncbi:hypothetical protein LX36DRAFT_373289 [Colletotrichum falcatum]|nr:hypothetical protein LX36DRAFT_373289 [Colletotrichum falcatum]